MQKIILFILSLSFSVQCFTQNLVVSGHQNDSIFYGQTFSTVITNAGSVSSTFYPRYYKSGRENIFKTETDYYNFIKSQITATDSVEMVIQCLTALASIHKSYDFSNDLLLFSEIGQQGYDTVVFAKKMSAIGSKFSQFHRQCGDYNRSGLQDLHIALNIPYSALHQVTHDGHATAEVFVKGNWIHFDIDPGTPGFLQINPVSPNGYASTADLVNDTGLIQTQYLFDSLIITGETLEEYRTFFPSAQPVPVQFTNTTEVLDGLITLCPGCSLEWNYELDSTTMLVDTSDIVQREALQKIYEYYDLYLQGNSMYADSVLNIFDDVFGFNQQQVIEIFDGIRPILTYHENFTPFNFQQLYKRKVPTLKLVVPSQPFDINIGEDLKMPFLITQVNTNGTIVVGDTTISDLFSVELWNDKTDSSNLNPPFYEGKAINYLSNGIIPAGVSAEFTLAFNPAIINFGRGFEIDQLNDKDTLDIVITPHQDVTVSAPQLSQSSENNMHVFPNPVSVDKGVTVINAVGDIVVYDLTGKVLPVKRKINDNKDITCFLPVAGTYIVSDGQSFKRVIVH